MGVPDLANTFAEWDQGELQAYLIEITAKVLAFTDPETRKPLVDLILDEAEQKGTGAWTAENALEIGSPTPTINSAVESRVISSMKTLRVEASKVLAGPKPAFNGDRKTMISQVRDALYASLITTYSQGMALLGEASNVYHYDFDLAEIARIWRAGCIIRARLLENIMQAFTSKRDLPNLMMDENLRKELASRQDAWRDVLQNMISMGIPAAATSASLAYYDAMRTAVLPANLTQAQRDFFGAHTYHRLDKEGVFHTEWIKPEET
jgi:6-phosphogluconate dehydrogenase